MRRVAVRSDVRESMRRPSRVVLRRRRVRLTVAARRARIALLIGALRSSDRMRGKPIFFTAILFALGVEFDETAPLIPIRRHRHQLVRVIPDAAKEAPRFGCARSPT